jgi:RNA polymerase sigma-70 factor (ECF subfamily)
MFSKAASYGSLWDFAAVESVAESQKWVLSAMQKHGRELVTMLWRILGNEQDVCDAYQDTFLQLAHFRAGRKPLYVKAYVFRTANNVAVSMLRRRIAERKRLSRGGAEERTTQSPAKELDLKHLQETLRTCIAQLPEHLRNVLTLRDLAQMSYAQVGKILGISSGTARVYRCKAIQLLAVWMNKEE